MLMLNGKFKRGIFSIPDPEKEKTVIPVEIHMRRKPEISANITGGKANIHAKVVLDANIMAIQSSINYETSPKLKELEQYTAGLIKTEMDKLVKKCQDLKCDVLGFGRSVVKCFIWNTVDEWEQYKWLEQFSSAQITTEVEVKIRHTGTLIGSSPILSTKGEE